MMTGFRLNFTPLKEPLGFVKLVEWVSAVGSAFSAKPGGRERASIPGFFFFFLFTYFKKKGKDSPKYLLSVRVVKMMYMKPK